MSYNPYGAPLRSPLDLLKSECPICGALYWRGKKAADCCKGTPEHEAFFRRLRQQNEAADARKHHRPEPHVTGVTLMPCPNCHGKWGNFSCPLCDGDGQVASNMLHK